MSKAQLNWYYYIKFTTWQVGRDGSKAEVIISTVNGYDYVPAIVLLTDKETATDVLEQVVNINSSFLCSAWYVFCSVKVWDYDKDPRSKITSFDINNYVLKGEVYEYNYVTSFVSISLLFHLEVSKPV